MFSKKHYLSIFTGREKIIKVLIQLFNDQWKFLKQFIYNLNQFLSLLFDDEFSIQKQATLSGLLE
jgi:hypothetical protein